MTRRKVAPLAALDAADDLEGAANALDESRQQTARLPATLRKASALLQQLHEQIAHAPGPADALLAMKPDDFDMEFDGTDAPELLRRVLVRMWPIYLRVFVEATLSNEAIADSIDLILSVDKHSSDFADTMEGLRDMSARLDSFIDQLQERWEQRKPEVSP